MSADPAGGAPAGGGGAAPVTHHWTMSLELRAATSVASLWARRPVTCSPRSTAGSPKGFETAGHRDPRELLEQLR